MRPLKSLFLFNILILGFITQSCKQPKEYALRIRRFDTDTVLLDKKTPLPKLIKRLENPWSLINTGDGFLIGYTDDMFSIASYKDKAIKPLIHFIENSDSLRAKIGGLYTLHLIGTNSLVAGRQYEEFKDTLARKALISFLNYPQLHETVISLIRRDPHTSDIPFLMNYLSLPDRDYSAVLSVLRRYQVFFYFLPIWQALPKEILDKDVFIYTNSDGSNELIAEMIALKHALNGKVVIDNDIMQTPEWKEALDCYAKKSKLVRYDYTGSPTGYMLPKIMMLDSFFFNPRQGFGFSPEDTFFYAFKNDCLFVYTPENARKLILDWWNSLSKEQVQQLTRTIKVI